MFPNLQLSDGTSETKALHFVVSVVSLWFERLLAV